MNQEINQENILPKLYSQSLIKNLDAIKTIRDCEIISEKLCFSGKLKCDNSSTKKIIIYKNQQLAKNFCKYN